MHVEIYLNKGRGHLSPVVRELYHEDDRDIENVKKAIGFL